MSKNLLSVRDLSAEEILSLSSVGDHPSVGSGVLAMLFQQASLRTMASFAIAGVKLGLTPVSISTTGGALRDQTDFEDELHQLSIMGARCIVTRSSKTFSRDDGRYRYPVPIINGGDGSNEHPTQALVDVAVIRNSGLDKRKMVMMGNLKSHRTTHSLALALRHFDIDLCAVSPASLAMPQSYTDNRVESVAADSAEEVDEVLCQADIVYIVPLSYYDFMNTEAVAAYSMSKERAERVLKKAAKIMHPFPRFAELDPLLDGSSYDLYHAQSSLGPAIRARVLSHLLHEA